MDIQTFIALTIVALCAVYVGWMYLRMLIRPEASACGHCAGSKGGGCPASRTSK